MLEDEFVDVFRKARRGTKTDEAAVAAASGVPEATVRAWAEGSQRPTDEQARHVASILGVDPAKFADSAAVRWHPDVAMPANARSHKQLVAGTADYFSNGFLFTNEDGTQAALVDPAGDPAVVLATIRSVPDATLRYVLITHEHADHSDAVDAIADAYPDATIVVQEVDAPGIGPLGARAHTFAKSDRLPFGSGEIEARHTPGHTDGSATYVYGTMVFTGDLLFAGSVGGSVGTRYAYADVLASVRDGVFSLSGDTVVMPGHGPLSTVALEKAHNPFFA